MTNAEIDANALREGAGVPHGEVLARFVAATFADDAATAAGRRACTDAIGAEAMIDAAAVIANFHMMTRIADGTGTPIDEGTRTMSSELCATIGIDDLVSRRTDPTVG